MRYIQNLNSHLENLYLFKGIENSFEADNSYLKKAFIESETMWEQFFSQMTKINFIVISEAPLWGIDKNYIYNPTIQNTKFFTRSDLGNELGIAIKNKVEFIEKCIEIGLLFIEIFPFALNKKITRLNFQSLNEYDYRYLFEHTVNYYFLKKLNIVSQKCKRRPNVAFRYTRTKEILANLIEKLLIQTNILNTPHSPLLSLSKQGGFIDRIQLSKFLTT